jgi:amino acid adenylation domain-containing protein
LKEDTHHFTWSFHHLLLDGWSVSAVLGQVFASYEAARQGQPLRLPPSRPYRDYIAWLQQQDLSRAEVFWRQTLRGFTASTPLGVDRTLTDSTSDYHDQVFYLPETTTAGLQAQARGQQLTLNTLVQGAWALLLSRYSGQVDVLFGVTVSGRPAALAGVEAMVGLFINTLPLRARVDPEQELLPWLHDLQAQQAEARQYEYSPLVQVQACSQVPRGQPLFESLLVFENFPVDASLKEEKSSLKIRHALAVERTNYPLTVTVVPGISMLVRVSYMGSRFDAATIERLAGHFQRVLESMIAQPGQHLGDLSLLTQSECQQLLVEWNAATIDYSQAMCLQALFEARVERAPEAIALVCEEQQLTYGELNARANQLAHQLRSLGVGPDSCVGLCLARSVELVIGLLGILKAGGAYVPIDPDSPAERLAFTLQDARAVVLVTQHRLLDHLPVQGATIVCMDRDWQTIAAQRLDNPCIPIHASNLAYVIYTSGSTGRPKGVMVSHQQVSRLFAGTHPWFRFNEQDTWTLFHSTAFDFSVWELWGALLYGGRLVVVPFWQSRSPEAFCELLSSQQITVLNQTPSAFRQLLNAREMAQVGEYGRLRLIIFGGEALDLPSVRLWFSRRGDKSPQLVNMYGITETTVHVTYCPLAAGNVQSRVRGPIGRPLPDLQAYVLDACGQLAPIGVTGEMYVGGAGLSRGYLGRPELTAERFVPHPFSRQAGARLYKTGDLARYLPDGSLEYLGRNDSQVKLRGFRIEPGEIEAVLSQHPGVSATVVIMREDTPGDKRLVAYVVADQWQPGTGGELRRYLQQRLPSYMLPATFVALETLPLTANGKVDRRALPRPDQVQPRRESAYMAPRTPVEEVLAMIWEQILQREHVGVYDNFLELGGHSLLATQIITRIRQALQVELPLRSLFLTPTVAALAEQVEIAQQAQQGRHIPTIKRLNRSPR